MIDSLLKVFLPLAFAFFIAVAITPPVTTFLYKRKLWKKSARKIDGEVPSEEMSPEFKRISNDHEETKTPRIGGIIIWGSVGLTALILLILSRLFPNEFLTRLDFLSYNQTLLLFFSFIGASLIGLIDDLMQVVGKPASKFVNGLSRNTMIAIVTAIGIVGGLWFFLKLDVTALYIPFFGSLELGWLIVPIFIIVLLGTFSSGVIDGIDGLAAGVLAPAFAAFATIAFFNNQLDIAAFSGTIAGGIMAFLWFNIPPARFYMGETGMLGLTVVLTVIAFLTDAVLILPIVGLPLVATSLSSFLQIMGKKFFGPEKGKLFRVAPLHHHFEVLGWSRPKITMRYWIIAVVFAVIGIIVALLG